jgi:hypothetical protein
MVNVLAVTRFPTMKITDVIMKCDNCGWIGKLLDAIPDIDRNGSLGCPICIRWDCVVKDMKVREN